MRYFIVFVFTFFVLGARLFGQSSYDVSQESTPENDTLNQTLGIIYRIGYQLTPFSNNRAFILFEGSGTEFSNIDAVISRNQGYYHSLYLGWMFAFGRDNKYICNMDMATMGSPLTSVNISFGRTWQPDKQSLPNYRINADAGVGLFLHQEKIPDSPDNGKLASEMVFGTASLELQYPIRKKLMFFIRTTGVLPLYMNTNSIQYRNDQRGGDFETTSFSTKDDGDKLSIEIEDNNRFLSIYITGTLGIAFSF